MKENIVRMHLFIPWLWPSVPTEPAALPAPLHFDALPLAGADCSGERVQSTLPAAWGMTPLRNTYMEMQLKAPFAESYRLFPGMTAGNVV